MDTRIWTSVSSIASNMPVTYSNLERTGQAARCRRICLLFYWIILSYEFWFWVDLNNNRTLMPELIHNLASGKEETSPFSFFFLLRSSVCDFFYLLCVCALCLCSQINCFAQSCLRYLVLEWQTTDYLMYTREWELCFMLQVLRQTTEVMQTILLT